MTGERMPGTIDLVGIDVGPSPTALRWRSFSQGFPQGEMTALAPPNSASPLRPTQLHAKVKDRFSIARAWSKVCQWGCGGWAIRH